MKRRLFLTCTLAALCFAGMGATQERPDGPPPGPPPGPPGGGLERILDDLKLTDKQKDKAKDVLKAHHEKMRKLMEQAHADLLKEMKSVLSEEQFKKFKEALDRRPPPPPPGPRDRPEKK